MLPLAPAPPYRLPSGDLRHLLMDDFSPTAVVPGRAPSATDTLHARIVACAAVRTLDAGPGAGGPDGTSPVPSGGASRAPGAWVLMNAGTLLLRRPRLTDAELEEFWALCTTGRAHLGVPWRLARCLRDLLDAATPRECAWLLTAATRVERQCLAAAPLADVWTTDVLAARTFALRADIAISARRNGVRDGRIVAAAELWVHVAALRHAAAAELRRLWLECHGDPHLALHRFAELDARGPTTFEETLRAVLRRPRRDILSTTAWEAFAWVDGERDDRGLRDGALLDAPLEGKDRTDDRARDTRRTSTMHDERYPHDSPAEPTADNHGDVDGDEHVHPPYTRAPDRELEARGALRCHRCGARARWYPVDDVWLPACSGHAPEDDWT